MNGIIFDIARFCLQDGPGIRTVVFFKGCPLRCVWCHNPESLSTGEQLLYRAHKCVGCGLCEKACKAGAHRFADGVHEVDFNKCTTCGACVDTCCYGALEIIGKEMTVQQVMDSLEVDRPYYGSDGGVTFTGGEPMLQFEFACALAKAIKESGLNLCIETSGCAPREQFERIAPYVDLFLYDYKATDEAEHKSLIGASNGLLLQNLARLNALHKRIVLRCPLVPGVNDSQAHLRAIAALPKQYDRIEAVEIMPYHSLGETKRAQLGQMESLPDTEQAGAAQKQQWLEKLLAYGCKAKIY